MKPVLVITLIFPVFIAIGCFGRSLTTREELGEAGRILALRIRLFLQAEIERLI
jgi:hypothetical protein